VIGWVGWALVGLAVLTAAGMFEQWRRDRRGR
jgi:hypothetical protein